MKIRITIEGNDWLAKPLHFEVDRYPESIDYDNGRLYLRGLEEQMGQSMVYVGADWSIDFTILEP